MELKETSISGVVYDNSTNVGLENVKIKLVDKNTSLIFPILPPKTSTSQDGSFTLRFNYDPSVNFNPSDLIIKITKKGYRDVETASMDGSGIFKSSIGSVGLISKSKSTTDTIIESSQIDPKTQKNITRSRKDSNYYTQKRLHNFITNVKGQITPILLEFLMIYGLYEADKLLKSSPENITSYINASTCPPKEELDLIIKQKNNLTKQINSIIKIVDSTIKYIEVTDKIIITTNIALNILSNIPIPTAVAGVGIPINVILKLEDTIQLLKTIISKTTGIVSGILLILLVLQESLLYALQLMGLLDSFAQHCYDQYQTTVVTSTSNPTQQDALLNQTLLNLNTLLDPSSNINDTSSITPNSVNGFFFSTETETTTKPLKRRRAIAKNKSGVSLLQGEWSFSSVDQILIDELIFYIQTNNLKAD
jgi:hypothetical protein